MILVIGATGTIGKKLTANLRASGHEVREATSKKGSPGFVNVLTGDGVTCVFDGVDRAFILSPGGIADSYSVLSPLISEAKRRGLSKVVLMTAMGANADDSGPMRRAEIELEKSGLSYNIIRPNWFMDNFTTYWVAGVQSGVLELPVGNAKTTFIDTRDIADVAAKLLVDDRFNNRDFDLTGPEALTHTDVASAISKVASHPVVFRNGTPEGLRAYLLKAGASPEYTEVLVTIIGYLAAGYSERKTDSVREITGHEPRLFSAFAKENSALF
jgi:uncharacterized protein YbjT (DUF2867 family)